MKIYVAARFHEKERVKKIQEQLKKFGHEITLDWTQCTTQKPYDSNQEDAQECARHAIFGVQEAEIFIFLTNSEIGAGSSAELGAALISNELRGFPAIYAVGSHRENNICLYHPAIQHVETIEQLFDRIQNPTFLASKKVSPLRDVPYPRIGVGVIILDKYKRILLGKRKNAHGAGDWAPPGGHLDFGETLIECATRELLEETGLALLDAKELTFTNDIFSVVHKHYVTIFVQGNVEGDPKVLEPHKCSEWKWFDLNDLPSPLFLPFNTWLKQSQLRNSSVELFPIESAK